MATPERMQLLTNALRASASRAAELVSGGSAVLFAAVPGEECDGTPKLRAAAGFASLDDARMAAGALVDSVRECGEARRAIFLEKSVPGMGARGEAGVHVLPLTVEDDCHGVLAVGVPIAPTPTVIEALELLAATTGIQLDHVAQALEIEALRAGAMTGGGASEPHSDELLKLSETLFAQDIELLRSQEKLGQIEKIKSDFIEKMSKELRTPLNSIIESTISVLAGENENLSEDSKETLRVALDEGTAFQRTLENILVLWRIKQGELPVEVQELNFSEVIDEAIFSVQYSLEDRPVAIEKRIDEPFPKVKTDLAKVNQILFLLLDNAAKFTNEGTIEITARVDEGVLSCQIRDTGIGICHDDLGYLYDEFFQVDERTTTRYRGAGLGLALVRDLLTLLDGSCSISSEAGEGTTATFQVPVEMT